MTTTNTQQIFISAPRQTGKLTALIRAAIEMAGPKGLTSDETAKQTGQDRRRCISTLCRLREDGELYGAGKHKHTRYFKSKQHAEAHAKVLQEQAKARAALPPKKVTQSNVVAVLKACGAHGADAIEAQARLPQHTLHQVYNTLSRMYRMGKAFRAGPYKAFRYFLEQEHATSYAQRYQLRQASATARAHKIAALQLPHTTAPSHQQPAQAAKGAQPATAIKALPASAAPVRVRPVPMATVVITPVGVKRIYVPAPKGRYEVDEPIIGGFSTMPIGRYDAAGSVISRVYGGAAC